MRESEAIPAPEMGCQWLFGITNHPELLFFSQKNNRHTHTLLNLLPFPHFEHSLWLTDRWLRFGWINIIKGCGATGTISNQAK